jgi:SAM-dependent methyltransferase
MNKEDNYLDCNRDSWNKKTQIHVESDFYDNDSFIRGKSSLNNIELQLLGDINGKSILHLQCHFGQDTISLARMGAKATGVDLSDKAIEKAIELTKITKSEAEFICCDVYDLPNHLDAQFDIVFTSYGTIGWLPDLNKWAEIVSRYLKPGGQFIFVEFHPVVWMFDDDFKEVKYRYFNSDPIIEIEEGTYADRDASVKLQTVSWNHGMSEVIEALLSKGLSIKSLKEYDYSPYNCFNHTIKIASGKYRIKHLDDKIPMVYSIVAMRPV